MIIKKLKLQNIRSYKDATIDFPLGKTLFEGDIGSGKSTILMAIEFALFGLGSEKGAALLKAGESQGKVGIIFDVDGKEYAIMRGLVKKRNTIQQTEGTLKTPEGLLHLSPTELKEKVLEILNFNEPPDPKAQSWIYRYAVFTPQEEMKTILFLRPDLRLQTLRKAFRLEDYKIATENAKELSSSIKLRAAKLEAEASDVPELKKKIEEILRQIAEKEKMLDTLKVTEQEKQGLLNNLTEEKNKLHVEEVQLSGSTADATHLDKLIRGKEKEIEEATEEIDEFKTKTKQLDHKVEKLEAIKKPTDKSQDELKKEINELEKREKILRKVETQLEAKLGDYESIQQSGNCPTCDRPANPEEFKEKITTKRLEKNEASRKVKECTKSLEESRQMLDERKEYDDAQEKLKDYRDRIDEYQEEIEKLKSKNVSAQKEIDEAIPKLRDAKQNLERLKEVSEKLNELLDHIQTVEDELRSIREGIARADATIKGWQKEADGYNEQIKKKEGLKAKSEVLKEYQIWIDDYFIPTLDAIEKHVMLNINQDFNAHFQKWFSMLVEDLGKEARIDEDFTPLVEQDGYEQEIYYLSGGEKTSVALSYRLALNSIVQKVSTGMQSNLLILDEPTDGFSKQQLAKVREILDELQSPQVIIVSHEKELESFAEQIFRVAKSHGVSVITH